ncbi:family 78 glycoside hydrolase catalytic domain [Streptomyces sp. NPDC006872]|uniref:family 78 glycoside hydrolase catalytic domain n=1 Tax=Streptomyces sp. NPDC006872 TaxID=3155720 RepID=UPI0033E2989C
MTIELQPAPMAIEELRAPRLSWVAASGAPQKAYQVKVGKQVSLAGGSLVWDSGRVDSGRSTSVAYAGPRLAPQTRYWWAVRTWSGSRPGPWSKVAEFGTAVKDSWKAEPIWAPGHETPAWADYTVKTKIFLIERAVGLVFRAEDVDNSYVWRFQADNRLVPVKRVRGRDVQLTPVDLPAGTIRTNKQIDVEITVSGPSITTKINDDVVSQLTDSAFPTGVVGVATGSGEWGFLRDISVVDTDGTTLTTGFTGDKQVFSCGTQMTGIFWVQKDNRCLVTGVAADWAFLRGDVRLANKPIVAATLYASGRSTVPSRQYVFRAYVNGRQVGVGPVPQFHSDNFYGAWDVTGLMREGAVNTVAAQAYTTQDQRFLAQLVVTYSDGQKQVFGTGRGWRALDGVGVYPPARGTGSWYYGSPREDLQASEYPWGFDEPGFDDASWQRADVKPALASPAPIAQQSQNIQVQDKAPQSVRKIGTGHYIIDFGRSWIGGLDLTLNGTAGQQVDVRLGEETDGPDAVRYNLRTTNAYRDVWTLKDGPQRLTHWGYRVFRYAELIGAPDDLTTADIRAAALVYPYDETEASFSSSNADLDQVWGFVRNSVQGLRFDLPYDSATRERTADNAGDTYNITSASDVLTSDRSWDRLGHEWSLDNPSPITEWRLATVLASRDHWLQTGDERSMRRSYDTLKSNLPEQFLNADGLVEKDVTVFGGANNTGNWRDLVDWPQADREGYEFTRVNTTVNAWSYAAFDAMSQIASALGNRADAEKYRTIATRMRAAINSKLWDADKGAFVDGLGSTHTAVQATAYAVAFGVNDDTDAAAAGDYLASRPMACSVFCANFLLKALADTGHTQRAVELMTDDGMRSWKHMMDLGAGATMEAWDPSLKSNTSFSHLWASAPVISTARDIFGISPTQAGYSRFRVLVRPGGLDHASITVPTVKGPIASSFTHDDRGRIRLAVQIPGNTTATVYVPLDADTPKGFVPAHPSAAAYQGRSKVAGAEFATFTVPSGSWTFGPGATHTISR